jgi:hypothetical protein
MASRADPTPMFSGRFGELYGKWRHLDPAVHPEGVRYINYVCCHLADACRDILGDFLYAGVSYGLGAKLVYEFTNHCAGKTFHLVDPFDASLSLANKQRSATYNSSADYVREQYAPDAKVVVHKTTIPMRPPKPLAFAALLTSDPASEEQALSDFFDALSPRGIIISCTDRGVQGVVPMWLPTGHAVFFKP